MKKILVVQPLRPEALRLFEDRPDVRFEVITDFSPDNILRHIGDADAMTIRDAPLPVQVLQAAPRLTVVSRHGVGYDNIPVDYCTSRGLPVTVVGSVNAVSVAEQTSQQAEVWALVRRVMEEELTPRQRQVLRAMVFEDVPLDEIVRHLGSNRNAVYKLVHDARRKLKAGLEARGYRVADILDLFGGPG